MSYKVKYDVEKVLYLANQEKMLNVSITEKRDTDLSQRVNALLDAGCLVQIPVEDPLNLYYRTTKKGAIKLLEMQIVTRTKLGKATDLHEFMLSEMRSTANV